jgi:hypothetical protein
MSAGVVVAFEPGWTGHEKPYVVWLAIVVAIDVQTYKRSPIEGFIAGKLDGSCEPQASNWCLPIWYPQVLGDL